MRLFLTIAPSWMSTGGRSSDLVWMIHDRSFKSSSVNCVLSLEHLRVFLLHLVQLHIEVNITPTYANEPYQHQDDGNTPLALCARPDVRCFRAFRSAKASRDQVLTLAQDSVTTRSWRTCRV